MAIKSFSLLQKIIFGFLVLNFLMVSFDRVELYNAIKYDTDPIDFSIISLFLEYLFLFITVISVFTKKIIYGVLLVLFCSFMMLTYFANYFLGFDSALFTHRNVFILLGGVFGLIAYIGLKELMEDKSMFLKLLSVSSGLFLGIINQYILYLSWQQKIKIHYICFERKAD
jgi:hypothetical protein